MNFIIDFGGVLYKINPEIALEKFKSVSEMPELLDDLECLQKKFITPFEKGTILSAEFRKKFRDNYHLNINNDEFDDIWNSLLIGILPDSISILKELKKIGKMILLSNTNEIHFNHFEPECKELFSIFDASFFSFQLGMVKPQPQIYRYVLKKTRINEKETYFIDDNELNIQAAQQLNINTYHINKQNTLSDFLHTVKFNLQNFI
jgi:putative hydrolase of the HAD superfamily